MSKPTQVLIIEPQNELKFKGPFNVAVTSYMKLTNPSDKKVLFKIKTTAPKKYCVRPNSGVLEPNSDAEIAISLQPFVFDPTEKNKHKFMVQTVYAPDGEVNIEQLWKVMTPDQLMDSKLKCVFEVPAEQNETQDALENQKTTLTANSPSIMPTSPDLEKAALEVAQLREEESSLRLENLKLKEEILLLKSSGNRSPVPNRYAPPPPEPQIISPTFIIAAFLIMILGIVFGKFAL